MKLLYILLACICFSTSTSFYYLDKAEENYQPIEFIVDQGDKFVSIKWLIKDFELWKKACKYGVELILWSKEEAITTIQKKGLLKINKPISFLWYGIEQNRIEHIWFHEKFTLLCKLDPNAAYEFGFGVRNFTISSDLTNIDLIVDGEKFSKVIRFE